MTATRGKLWHVQAAGRSAAAEFLDQAVDLVLPRLSNHEQDNLLTQLLTARTHGDGPPSVGTDAHLPRTWWKQGVHREGRAARPAGFVQSARPN